MEIIKLIPCDQLDSRIAARGSPLRRRCDWWGTPISSSSPPAIPEDPVDLSTPLDGRRPGPPGNEVSALHELGHKAGLHAPSNLGASTSQIHRSVHGARLCCSG